MSGAARCFDDEGRLTRWPASTGFQTLCLWAIWPRIPRGAVFDERAISTLQATLHRFGDHAILRRTMCALGMLTRTSDGRDYRRVGPAPLPDGAALIRRLGRAHPSPRPRTASSG